MNDRFAPLSTVITLGALLGLGACTTVGGEGQSQANPLDQEENALVVQLNAVRGMAGVGVVAVCASLDVSASAHSDDMRDNGYLTEMSPDGTTVHTRGCAAGYTPGCTTTDAMAELVASGVDTGKDVMTLWQSDAKNLPILTNSAFVVTGVGRSLGPDGTTYFTLDLADKDDPSCN